MIRDLNHAVAVQERRMSAKRRGYAKAVRRFAKASSLDAFGKYHHDAYVAMLAQIPANW